MKKAITLLFKGICFDRLNTTVLFLLLAANAFAQDTVSSNKFIRLTYENDYFTTTDEYYTQGIKLEGVAPGLRYSPIMWLLPTLSHATVQYGLVAAQDCFTPTSISSNTILQGDRPFAGYIYLGHYKISADYSKKQMLTTEIDAGAIGPCAECEEEQKAIHHLPGNTQPVGWQYQIASGALVDYKVRYEKAIFADTAVDVDAVGQLTAGTVYDNVLLGITMHAGKMQSYFLTDRTHKLQLYAIVKGWVQGVAYDGTLQGDLFTHNSIY